MRITSKLTFIISGLFLLLAGVLGWKTYHDEKRLIQKLAVDKARIIARQIITTRDYLSKAGVSASEQNYNLVPQVVATRIAEQITQDSPYYVRQVSLRQRNPANAPDSFERQILERPNTAGTIDEQTTTILLDGREELRYMLTMRAEESCLACHGSYASAPTFVQKRFPAGHSSYGYTKGEIIGAISVRVPLRELYRQVGSDLLNSIVLEVSVLLLLLVGTGYLLKRTILQPIMTVANGIGQVADTGDYSLRVPPRGNGEIGHLITTFNELMSELERRTLQKAESDERYRNFIEIAQSPIVTFVANGKIVISNQKAERLFGLTKDELLGQSIFDFMVNPTHLEQGIHDYFTAGSSSMIGTTSEQIVRDVCGREIAVEMVISVSQTEHEAMFTAILRTNTAASK